MPLLITALILGGYLLGSIPFGVIVGRSLRGIDIREYGSGNTGFSNALRVLGWKAASAVFVGDVLKGFIPVFVARCVLAAAHVPSAELWLLPVALGPILGHCFSVFLGFRGGRAIATTLGVLLGLAPVAGLSGLGMWLVVVAITRYISLASIAACITVPVVVALRGARWELIAFWSAIALLIILRHLPNMKRLLAGTETRIGEKVDVGDRESKVESRE
jgi:acyl phosphate:glycerol-3-phosphate acyltransferase